MDGARVSDQERSLETLAPQGERGLDIRPRLIAPVGWERSEGGDRERVEPKRDRAIPGSCARSLDQRREAKRLIGAVGPKIEFETGPGIETHAVESSVKRRGIEVSQAKTVSPDRAGGHDLQAVRSIGDVVVGLGVGAAGAGSSRRAMIRQGPPRRIALGPSAGG